MAHTVQVPEPIWVAAQTISGRKHPTSLLRECMTEGIMKRMAAMESENGEEEQEPITPVTADRDEIDRLADKYDLQSKMDRPNLTSAVEEEGVERIERQLASVKNPGAWLQWYVNLDSEV